MSEGVVPLADEGQTKTAVRTGALRRIAVPAALYALAAVAYAAAARLVDFAVNEGSAYYVAVAGNLAAGRGLVIDAIWSYATPPLILPRPAFELWQPLASLLAAGPIALLGDDLPAAQLGMAAVGALLAPLAWYTCREAASTLGLGERHTGTLAIGAGVVSATMGPFILPVAMPDSTIPFAVAATAACAVVGRALVAPPGSRSLLWLALGVACGIAWLARHEAVWIALAAVLLTAAAGALSRRMLASAIVGGLLVATPWLARNLLAFGTPLPGQAVDNALLTANDGIFAYLDQPSVDAFLAQGGGTLVANVVAAVEHNLVDVLLIPAAPVALTGLLATGILMWRHRRLRTTSLGTLILAGAITFAVNSVVFPVASLWGTFEHAAGFIHLALLVAAVLGLDRFIQAVGRRRGWQRGNAWMAPLALGLLMVPLTGLQLAGLRAQADHRADHWDRLGQAVLAQPEVAGGGAVVVADRPIWLAEATGLSALALPAEPLSSLEALVADFGVSLVVVSEGRGEYPALLASDAAARCFSLRPAQPGQPAGTAIYAVDEGCR
jgi:hypothetical protein